MALDVIPKFENEHFWLSNFYQAPVEVPIYGDRMRFKSSEAGYQAMKYLATKVDEPKTRQWLMQMALCEDPGQSKKLGRNLSIDVAKWDSVKDEAMRQVVFSKFLLDETLRAMLLETGAIMLVEGNTWGDKYWGRVEGKGLNKLGAILMEVRGFWQFYDKMHDGPMTERHVDILMGWSVSLEGA